MKPLPYERRKQILKLLAEHEPLSVRGLSTMLEPKAEPRRLRDSLQRLHHCGLIQRQNYGVFGNTAIYYRLSRDPRAKAEIKKITGLDDSLWDRSHPRISELLHWEECAVFAHKIKTKFPEKWQNVVDLKIGA